MTELFLVLLILGLLVCGLLFLPVIKLRGSGNKASYSLPVLLSLFVLVSSFTLYAFRGSPLLLPKLDEFENVLAEKKLEIESLAKKSADAPKDVSIKVSLANAYISIGDYARAKELYREVIILSNGNPSYIMMFGRLHMMEAGGNVTPEAKKAFEMVLLQEKENPMALYYLAIEARQQNRNAEAKERFEKVLKLLPEGIPLRGMIEKQINEIK